MSSNRFCLQVCVVAAVFVLSACSQDNGSISRDSEPFAGIDAGASISVLGNEPFWSMDIEPAPQGYMARYSSPENIDGTGFAVERFAGNNGIGFNGELDGAAVQIALTPGECSDSMTDRSYPYTATLALGDETLFGCAYTSDEPFSGDSAP